MMWETAEPPPAADGGTAAVRDSVVQVPAGGGAAPAAERERYAGKGGVMAQLKNTKVYRGGVTAQYLTHETRECSFHANTKDRALDIRFRLASKGGGTTEVLL